jgi:Holliday junction DNA helicase RuvB
VLYPALEDFELDLVIGEGPAARTVRIELQPFTLIGATTRLGLLTTPLRDRFGIPTRLNFYTVEELDHIVRRGARLAGIEAEPAGTMEIAGRARGTPRIAGRLLRRVIDFALVEGDGRLSRAIADAALTRLGVDKLGLDAADRRYLTLIAENYGGGPVGIETIAAALAEPRDALEEVIEPFLLQQGLIARTPRGRMLARKGWQHLGLPEPEAPAIRVICSEKGIRPDRRLHCCARRRRIAPGRRYRARSAPAADDAFRPRRGPRKPRRSARAFRQRPGACAQRRRVHPHTGCLGSARG